MDNTYLLTQIDKGIFTRQDILEAAYKVQDNFKETQLRNLLENLLKNNYIIRVGRNQYAKQDFSHVKKIYTGHYSKEAMQVVDSISKAFPYLDYRVWELCWLNEFLNHLVAHNKIFVEVDKEGREFLFTALSEKYDGNILLAPSQKELDYYSKDNTIIIDSLASQAPKGKQNIYDTPIEKIIVDLFANKKLRAMIPLGDLPDMLNRIFDKYVIDESMLMRYAKRRHKDTEIKDYIAQKTNIKLYSEDK